MKQIFVAAWVGITVGWMGFGWVLAAASVDATAVATAQIESQPVSLASVDILAEPQISAKEPVRKEPNLRS